MNLSTARASYGVSAVAAHIGPESGSARIGDAPGSHAFADADVAYMLRAIAAGSGDVLALDLLTGSTAGSTAFVAGNAQTETATVVAAGGCTADGTMTLVLTAAGLTGSPLSVPVALTIAAHTTADLIAAAAAAALAANVAVAEMFAVTASGADILLTRRPTSSHTVPGGTLDLYGATDATLNLAIPGGLGVTAAASSANTLAGVASDGIKLYGAGADFEGEALPAIVTLYAVQHAAATGSAVIAGDVDDLTPIAAGGVVQQSNASGLTCDTALTLTAASQLDITLTVIGRSS